MPYVTQQVEVEIEVDLSDMDIDEVMNELDQDEAAEWIARHYPDTLIEALLDHEGKDGVAQRVVNACDDFTRELLIESGQEWQLTLREEHRDALRCFIAYILSDTPGREFMRDVIALAQESLGVEAATFFRECVPPRAIDAHKPTREASAPISTPVYGDEGTTVIGTVTTFGQINRFVVAQSVRCETPTVQPSMKAAIRAVREAYYNTEAQWHESKPLAPEDLETEMDRVERAAELEQPVVQKC